jgi:putative transferase (TIGR04331 family)
LSLKYRQIPQIWTDYSLPFFEVDKNKRKAIDFPKKRLDHFLDFLRNMIPETLPTIFFEGYSSLVECSQKTSWPLDPKIIFTSNAFYFDEVFKTWVARKSSLGVLYYIGQHGNNYGTKIGNANSIELLTCDKFFTWGWQYNHKKHIKGFNFKISHKQNQLNIPSTGILLIELHPLHRIGPFDDHGIFKKYLSNQFSFVNHLPENIRSKLTVRLHSASKYFQWKEDVLWKARFKDIKIDTGGKDIFKLMFNSKLVVHSYDSTGILETLCLNIPTLCFWDKEFDHIEENAKPFYIMLKDSNIYFNSPESLASHISEIWDNLDSWWYSEKVQNARLSFVDQFSRKSNNCADDIYNLINLTIK